MERSVERLRLVVGVVHVETVVTVDTVGAAGRTLLAVAIVVGVDTHEERHFRSQPSKFVVVGRQGGGDREEKSRGRVNVGGWLRFSLRNEQFLCGLRSFV